MILYFLLGTIFLAILDMTLWKTADADGQFTNFERIFVLVCWPYFLLNLIIKRFRQ